MKSSNPPLRLAFAGFRHGHIYSLYNLAKQEPTIEIVAACEEDAGTRQQMANGPVAVTHDNHRRMLEEVPCEAVAVGDYYGARGAIIIEALRRGKHVIGDKPLCTSADELAVIARLAREQHLAVGCQLNLRDHPAFRAMHAALRDGAIGTVLAIAFTGQHSLNYGTRPAWYFEPGKHGGTINDIAIHALDFILWATGCRIARVNAARVWNANLPQVPWFQDGAQMMLTLDNGAGVLGDVSYFVPATVDCALPQGWRFTCWGSEGILEGGVNSPPMLYRSGKNAAETLPPPEATTGNYLQSFLDEIRGNAAAVTLSTQDVLESARAALAVQHAADHGLTNVEV